MECTEFRTINNLQELEQRERVDGMVQYLKSIKWKEIEWKRPHTQAVVLGLALSLAIGFFIGLVVFGWWLWPVEWVDAGPHDLSERHQARYVLLVSELYAYQQNRDVVIRMLGYWDGDRAACRLAGESADLAAKARLVATAHAVNGVGCPPAEVGGGLSGFDNEVTP